MATPVSELLGRGIDQFHPETRIPDGYSLDLQNVDATAAGTLRKRSGWERFAGWMPLRVRSISRTGSSLVFRFDEWVDTSLVRSSPIVVYGKRGVAGTGDFSTTDTVKYYSGFTPAGPGGHTIAVTDSASGTISVDSDVQLTVWGIDPAAVVAASAGDRAAWVTGLASYRSSSDEHLVALMGGLLHAGLPRSSVGSSHLLPTRRPRLRATVSGTQILGRAFYDVVPGTAPERGYIYSTSAPGGLLRVASASYSSSTGRTTYVLSAPGYTLGGVAAISDCLRPNVDRLSVEGMGAALDGDHLITAVSVVSTSISVECENEANDAADRRRSEAEAYGRAGVFSDQLTTSSGGRWIAGDRVASSTLTEDDYGLSVFAGTDTTVVLGPFDDPVSVANSQILYGTRTARVVQLRAAASATADVSNIVRGDVLDVTGYDRRIVVRNVWTAADDSVSITSDGVEATVTGVASTTGLSEGDWLLLVGSTSFDGAIEVSEIVSSTSFTFESTEVVSVAETATLLGGTIGLDEAIELADDAADSTSVDVGYRWIPREAPSTSSTVVPQTYNRHFDYFDEDAQEYVSSAMLGENLYLSNGYDEILKYDGENVYRTGLPSIPFAVHGMVRQSDTPIVNNRLSVAYTNYSGRALTIAAGDEEGFTAGDYVEVVDASDVVVPARIVRTKSGALTLDFAPADHGGGPLDTTGVVYRSMVRRYYLRPTYIDANGNRISGPGVRSADFNMRMGRSAEVQFVLVCFPPVDNYDWDRIEIEVYATTGTDGLPPFSRIGTLAFPFESTRSYVYFRDVVQTDGISSLDTSGSTAALDPDPTSVLTGGASVGAGWREPPRSKCIASLSNRLALANVRSNKQMTLTVRRKRDVAALAGTRVPSLFAVRRTQGGDTMAAAGSDVGETLNFQTVTYGSGNINTSARIYQYDANSFVLDVSAGSMSSVGVGTWVYLFHIGRFENFINRGAPYCGWFQIRSVISADKYQIAYPQKWSAFYDVTAFTDATDTFTVATGSGIATGDPVFLRRTAGTAVPTSLTEFSTYYARVSGTSVTLHPTQTDAIANANKVAAGGGDATWTTGQLELHYGDVDGFPWTAAFAPSRSSSDSYVPVYITGNDNAAVLAGASRDRNYADAAGGDVINASSESVESFYVRRLADAINCVMRSVDASLSGQESFRPWLIARAGNDVGYGVLQLESPTATTETFRASTYASSLGNWELLVDGQVYDYTNATGPSASELLFPSRVVISYQNYPELFDRPFAYNALLESDSAVDLNPNDGDEIVAIRPFFGESFSPGSSGSAREQLLLVEKNRSKYALNVETREFQLIETNETGCDFPRTLAATKSGLASVAPSGIHAVDRSLSLRYIGEALERWWERRANRSAVEDVPCAIHDSQSKKYLLAMPVLDDQDGDTTRNTEVWSYDYVRDPGTGPEYGSWSRWTGTPTSAWAYHAGELFRADYSGTVYRRRSAGDASDFRDDASAIPATVRLRPTAFGAPGLNKRVVGVQIEYRSESTARGTTVAAANGLDLVYLDADDVVIQYSDADDGIGDRVPQATWSVRYTLPEPRGEYFSLQIENSTIDEALEVCGVTWLVEATGPAGAGVAAARTT